MPRRVPAPISISAEAQNMLADAQPMDLPALKLALAQTKSHHDFGNLVVARVRSPISIGQSLAATTLAVLLAACSGPNVPATLTPIEKQAFVVLVDRLGRLPNATDNEPLRICVSYSLEEDTSPLRSDALSKALRQAIPEGLTADVINDAPCDAKNAEETSSTDRNHQISLCALRTLAEQPNSSTWIVRWTCRPDNEGGYYYRVEMDGDQPKARLVSIIFS